LEDIGGDQAMYSFFSLRGKLTYLSAALLGLLLATPAAAQAPFDPPGLDRAMAAKDFHVDGLMATDGVVGVAVGVTARGQAAIVIMTEDLGVVGLPRSLDGVPVVVRFTGEIFALNPPPHGHPTGGDDGEPPPGDCTSTTKKFRPACIGISTGHPNITAGTIGARVWKGIDVFALSNNHVYADTNQATIGDNVLQPGSFDGGMEADDIGTLFDFEPILFDPDPTDDTPGPDNIMDAAIAISSEAVLGNATPSDGYGTPKSVTITAIINQKVKKYGRTTKETEGKVDAINATVNVCYEVDADGNCSKLARFVQQIIIIPGSFSAGGDSGSLIVANGKGKNKADDRKPVGLLFAGSVFITVANRIDDVLDRFGVSIDGE
jgi:hypothetical protein